MERKKKIPLLFLLAVFEVCLVKMEICQSQPDKNLTCYTDYNHSITCAWNSKNEPDHSDAACTLHAKKVTTKGRKRLHSASCQMEPADMSSQKMRRCILDFKTPYRFVSHDNLSISLTCDPRKQILTVFFKPACHIKLNPPGKPDVNFTTVSWSSQVKEQGRVTLFTSELQWKSQDQSWSDPPVQKEQTKTTTCNWNCEAQLDPDSLVRGETYEARARVQADESWAMSVWSDWGPTASWESPVGIIEPTSSEHLPDSVRGILGIIITGTALALFLTGIVFKNDKAIWVYKKIIGQPPPDPGKSFLKDLNFQNWLSPHFTSESLHSSLKRDDIDFVEVIPTVDHDTLCGKEMALPDKMRNESMRIESTSSSFSNPSYSQLCPLPPPPPPPPPPPVTMATADSLESCDNDTSNRSTGCQDKDESAEKYKEEKIIKEMQIVQLLSIGNNNNSEQVRVVSDYEKVEKLQEHFSLQSLDLGICSDEEVSQESLEADSINVSERHDEGPESREGVKGLENKKEVIFQKIFGGDGGSVFCKGSIHVCSDYEQVLKLQPASPELPSLDSGLSSGGEEQVSHEESLEDVETTTETTNFLFPPTPCALSCTMPSFPQLAFTLSGTGLSPALQPSSLSQIVRRIALMEISGDGYMPVRQESR